MLEFKSVASWVSCHCLAAALQDADMHISLRPWTTSPCHGRTPTNTPASAGGGVKTADMETTTAEVEFAIVKHVDDDATPGMQRVRKPDNN